MSEQHEAPQEHYDGSVLVLIDEGRVLLEGGQSIDVEDWFDEDGEYCDAHDAVSCVAGPNSEGQWLAIDLTALEDVSEH